LKAYQWAIKAIHNDMQELLQAYPQKHLNLCGNNLIKIQLFIILLYEHLTVACIRSCADLCSFCLREFHHPIKMFESFQLSEVGKSIFDWLTKKVICTWPTTGRCQIFIW